MEHPGRLIGIGLGLLLVGAVLPFMMVINLVQSTLPLNLVAVLASVGGITMGLLGMTLYRRTRK
jgi:membrane associated rhomboid family serine protease